jgi:hypothetical protein
LLTMSCNHLQREKFLHCHTVDHHEHSLHAEIPTDLFIACNEEPNECCGILYFIKIVVARVKIKAYLI